MVDYVLWLRLGGHALGALGAVLVFLEFFQVPSYWEYDTELMYYSINHGPNDIQEYTWFGRVGALLVALAFTLQFFAVFLG